MTKPTYDMKKLILLLFIPLVLGCSSGGDNCDCGIIQDYDIVDNWTFTIDVLNNCTDEVETIIVSESVWDEAFPGDVYCD